MGACGSTISKDELDAISKTRAIDKKNRMANSEEQSKIKLLLLGTGESGKSTIFKQMKILYGKKYTPAELKKWTATVHGNIISNMKSVLEATEKFTPLSDESLKEKIDGFLKLEDGKDAKLDSATGELISAFWADAGLQDTWHHRAHYQVQDALAYYADDIARIVADGYIPNEQDVLRTRVRTSGIVEEVYIIDGATFVMFDVGGQRNERKKWIHCFESVTAVIFVAAINEYDQVLFEDETMNRMDEAVTLFDEIANSPFFTKTAMILFLNKVDLFKEKLAEVPFRVDKGPDARNTDYNGATVSPGVSPSSPEFEQAYQQTTQYLLGLFMAKNPPGKSLYHHITCATDTRNVSVVFEASRDIILKLNLQTSGFIAA